MRPRSASQTSPGCGFIYEVEDFLFYGARAGEVERAFVGAVDDFGDALADIGGGFRLPVAEAVVKFFGQSVHSEIPSDFSLSPDGAASRIMYMAEPGMTETIPLALNEDGVLRVSGTRVTLDTVVGAFREGAAPEEIAQQYPSLPPGDIYELIGYALRHPEEVEEYRRKEPATRSPLVQAAVEIELQL